MNLEYDTMRQWSQKRNLTKARLKGLLKQIQNLIDHKGYDFLTDGERTALRKSASQI